MFIHKIMHEWVGGQNVLSNSHKVMELMTVLLYFKFFHIVLQVVNTGNGDLDG